MLRRFPLSGPALALMLALALPAAGQTNDVQVALDQFGVGSAMRPGDLVGMRVEITSRLDQPTPIWVQWEKPNADGDIAEYGRALTVNPNNPVKVWLYAPLSEDDSTSDVWSVKVFEDNEGVRGREIGGARITAAQAQAVDIGTSLIGVVGSARLGLEQYMVAGPRGRSLTSNEETRIISGIRPEDLPDRWYGLMSFEAIAWGTDASPTNLGIDQADALREYIRRGGHLIIVLPAIGNPWRLGTQGQTLFDDLMPPRPPDRQESVPLTDVLPVLTKASGVPGNIVLNGLNVFGTISAGDADAYDPLRNNYYDPLIALPDGRIVVVQRTYGFGRITICGIDVANGQMLSVGVPQADAFWNRILGRRMDTPSAGEIKGITDAQRLSRSIPNSNNLGSGNLFVQFIQHEQSASVGILLAFILFVIYWLVAGPGGFYTLKHYKQVKHAWLAFAATAGLFTALAWGAVAAVRPRTITFRHVTVLDHIARTVTAGSTNPDRGDNDSQLQRAISFGSVFLPNYRDTRLAIEGGDGRDLLVSWDPPGVSVSPFPNVAHYTVDVSKGFSSFSLPSRSTTTRLYANWLGGVDTAWGGLLREDPADPIKVEIDPTRTERSISGSIISELPGPLTNITVIWVKNQRLRPRTYFKSGDEVMPWITPTSSGQMLNTGNIWKVAGTVQPGQSIPLSVPVGSILSQGIQQTYVTSFRSSFTTMSPTGNRSISPDDRRRYMEMLSIFEQLDPPTYILTTAGSQGDQQTPTFYRTLGRELDLSPWFNRPCLIVIGWLQDSELPFPMTADGDPVASDGLTVIRWIYPLPLVQDIAFKNVVEDEEN